MLFEGMAEAEQYFHAQRPLSVVGRNVLASPMNSTAAEMVEVARVVVQLDLH